MKPIILPQHYNYIGAFLTLRCNLNCSYCLNKQGKLVVSPEMSGEDWIKGLSRIETREDLPITLQGGEPTMHKDFHMIASDLYEIHKKKMDLLTNGKFNVTEFLGHLHYNVFNRKAPYASIRFSYHQGLNDFYLTEKLDRMHSNGYNIGVWGLSNKDNTLMAKHCKDIGVDFRTKEYLDKDHGTYKYPEAVSGELHSVMCKPSELLINPFGNIYRCHADLYAERNHIGHILDEEITFPDYLPCDFCGECNPCDIKLKTNRLQEDGHCSVTIKND